MSGIFLTWCCVDADIENKESLPFTNQEMISDANG